MRRDLLDQGPQVQAAVDHRAERLPRSARPDAPSRSTASTSAVGGAPQLATMFDEESSFLPGRTLLLAAGDNVGASPPNSALLDDRPAIDVENAWGLDATSFGNHEFDFGVERILEHQERANFPFLSTNIVEEATGRDAGLDGDLEGVPRERRARRRDRLDGPDDARARACRRHRGARLPRRGRAHRARVGEAPPARREGADRGDPRGRRRSARTASTASRAGALGGPDHRDHRGDPGHDGRPRDRRPHAPSGQHRRRPHPGRRGLQRRRQLLGGAADALARRRRLGRAPPTAPPRTSAWPRGRRAGDRRRRPTPRPRCSATR